MDFSLDLNVLDRLEVNMSKFKLAFLLAVMPMCWANSSSMDGGTSAQAVDEINEQSKTGPSFPCAMAKTEIEKMICENSKLSGLDKEMSDQYQAALSSVSESKKNEVKKTQKEWLQYRRDNCKDDRCLVDAYTDRITRLNYYIKYAGKKYVEKREWKYTCDHIKKYLAEQHVGKHWLIETSKMRVDPVFWEPLDINASLRGVYMDCGATEIAQVDINNDGEDEYVVRFIGCLSSYYAHVIYLFDHPVQQFDPKKAKYTFGELGRGEFNEIDIIRVGGILGEKYLRVSAVNSKQEYLGHRILRLKDNYEPEEICQFPAN